MKTLLTLILLALTLAGFSGCSDSGHPTGAKPQYQCPMHPFITSDRPGKCPICGMDLVPIKEGGAAQAHLPHSTVPGLAVIAIDEPKRQQIGLKLAKVEKRQISREIRTSARIVADETRLWRVTTKVEGWVEQLFVAYIGQHVNKGDPLLSIYSPEVVAAQSEYVTALKARSGMADTLIKAARRRLELWDISDEQLERLTRAQKVERAITLHSPATGVVLERNVLAGAKVDPSNPLMVIADLSVVWADADIYQSDLPNIREGMPLQMTLPYWPGKTFEGKVVFVSPTVEQESRTLRARLEIPNPELLLKPGMFGDAALSYGLGEKLSIPASAVMVSGDQNYAFRDLGDGHLVPVTIRVGARGGDFYELLGGLKEGDRVVASANFLVDSESNLKAALEAMNAGGGAEKREKPAGTPAPAAPHQHSGMGSAAAPAVVAGLSEPGPGSQTPATTAALKPYLQLQRSLASDDLSASQTAARALEEAGVKEARAIASAATLKEARKNFKAISEMLIGGVVAGLSEAGPGSQTPATTLFIFECPMADDEGAARWLQDSRDLRNPYLGASMLKCGELKEQIPAP